MVRNRVLDLLAPQHPKPATMKIAAPIQINIVLTDMSLPKNYKIQMGI